MDRKIIFAVILISATICVTACAPHFIRDGRTRVNVHDKFEARRAMFTDGDLFDIFDAEMTTQEREAMEFLYASMSIADMGDYDGAFFLDNVRTSLRAREHTSWGRYIPDDLFRHFVLPVRVNNERLDEFRTIYADTLLHRVAGLSLHDAALEINHWCHERATYTPSDSRTSSPLAVMLTAEGRCGEESTFTVAAMRAAGIPARQVYTPRWAHTDDNHAWVEVWIDGRWQFLGACEPEAELNMAWFTQPASRAMLMHTRVYGDYNGTEDVIQRTNCFTEINVVSNYAPVRNSTVTVTDTAGNPIEGAVIEFKIYNYGEYCTVVTLASDEQGSAQLHTGLGDMIVWASYEGKFGFGKLSSDSLTIKIDHAEGDPVIIEEDITPPAQGNTRIEVSDEAVAANKLRLSHEDSLRMAYTATFPTMADFDGTGKFGAKNYDAVSRDQIIAARGNWREVQSFIDSSAAQNDLPRAEAMLASLSRKDLRDTPAEVLVDALNTTAASLLTDEYVRYILSPRIEGEFLRPYRYAIGEALTQTLGNTPSAEDILKWTADNIAAADDYNPLHLQATPAGVLRCRHADTVSRGIFFVAACRTFGIAARVNTLDGRVQYKSGEEWADADLGSNSSDIATQPSEHRTGYLRMHYDPTVAASLPDPEYYRHFTIAKIENGRCRLLEFDGGDATELGAAVSAEDFSRPFALDEGYYMLTSGCRMADGKVLSRAVAFSIADGQTTDVDLIMRQSTDEVSVIGYMDAEQRYLPENSASEVSLLSTTGRGYFIVAVMGAGDEPTNHALRDLAAMAEELKAWDRPIVILTPSQAESAKFNRNLLGDVKAAYGVDVDQKVRTMLCESCHSQAATLPIIAVCDSFGRAVYFSQGYNTSLGEQLKSVIHKL